MANEKRVRANGVAGAVDTSSLTSGSTTLNSAALADLPAVDSTNHAALTLFTRDATTGQITAKEIVYVTAHTASATSATIVRGQEGTTAAAWSTGDKWVHAPTVRDSLKIASVRRTTNASAGADYLVSSTNTWLEMDSTNMRLTVPAYAGDVLLVSIAARPRNTANIFGDVATVVSGSPVNYVSSGNGTQLNNGIGALFGNTNAEGVACTVAYQVQSGDLASGSVTLSPFFKGASTTNSGYYATDHGFFFTVTNTGPQQSA